ncbi:hypothetical protein EMCRGX_G018194 [Ephydatia muelleri]
MADSKELCDAKKERDVAIAKRDAWKKELEEGSSLKCKQVAQANEKLTQCQQQLELERKGVKYLAIQTETMKKGCKQAGSDLLRVMNEVETKSQVDIAELTKKVQSLEQEIQQWKYKYESMVAENETKSAPARMRLKDLEDQMESMEQMSSERHSDLISKISELEITLMYCKYDHLSKPTLSHQELNFDFVLDYLGVSAFAYTDSCNYNFHSLLVD